MHDDICPRDVTFFAMGDPQYGGGAEDKNELHITALNWFPGTIWSTDLSSAGTPVADPRGVIICGDLTQNGKDGRLLIGDQIGQFVDDYGLTGSESRLRYPVYEGYGNHDFDAGYPVTFSSLWRLFYNGDTPAADIVAERNAQRVGLTTTAPGFDGHYSWDWDHVHFVQLNLFPGDEPSPDGENSLLRDPRHALSFLDENLATHVGASCRPVVLAFHYGFDSFGREPRWWGNDAKELFADVIAPYNVLAILHGHTHATNTYRWNDIQIFNVGSPYYTKYNTDDRGHFTVFRITADRLEASDARWSPDDGGESPEFGRWSVDLPITTACP